MYEALPRQLSRPAVAPIGTAFARTGGGASDRPQGRRWDGPARTIFSEIRQTKGRTVCQYVLGGRVGRISPRLASSRAATKMQYRLPPLPPPEGYTFRDLWHLEAPPTPQPPYRRACPHIRTSALAHRRQAKVANTLTAKGLDLYVQSTVSPAAHRPAGTWQIGYAG